MQRGASAGQHPGRDREPGPVPEAFAPKGTAVSDPERQNQHLYARHLSHLRHPQRQYLPAAAAATTTATATTTTTAVSTTTTTTAAAAG